MGDAIQEKGIFLEERLEPNLPPVEADPDQLEQVLLNLLKNALEATGETRQNSVKLRDQGRPGVVCGPGYGQRDAPRTCWIRFSIPFSPPNIRAPAWDWR